MKGQGREQELDQGGELNTQGKIVTMLEYILAISVGRLRGCGEEAMS